MNKNIKTQKVEGPSAGSFICYRGYQIKPAVASTKNVSVVETHQIEIGPYGSFKTKITGKEDYMAKVAAQKDNCGIAILKKLAKANDKDALNQMIKQTVINEAECGDCTNRPETFQDMKNVLSKGEQAQQQINAIAGKYGLTGGEFIDAFVKGTLNDVLAAKTAAITEEKGE